MNRKYLAALAVLPTTALVLTGCGSSSDKGDTSANSSTSASSSTSPAASAQASTSASPAASASSSAAANSGKQLTAAELGAILKTVDINGTKLQPMDQSVVQQSMKSAQATLTAIKSATVTPEACKQVQMDSMAAASDLSRPMAIAYSTTTPIVVVRQMPSADSVAKVIELNKKGTTDCATMSMEFNFQGQKAKSTATMKALDVDAPSTTADAAYSTTSSAGTGRTTKQNIAIGQVGSVMVQVTDIGGKFTPAQLQSTLEATAAAVAKKA